VATCMYFIHWVSIKKNPRRFSEWVDFWICCTERFVATSLVIVAPSYLPAFIRGWVALKFALNWKRRDQSDETAQASLLALVGNVLSFGIAICVGVLVNPHALDVWNAAATKS
jgi:hypothetical protein